MVVAVVVAAAVVAAAAAVVPTTPRATPEPLAGTPVPVRSAGMGAHAMRTHPFVVVDPLPFVPMRLLRTIVCGLPALVAACAAPLPPAPAAPAAPAAFARETQVPGVPPVATGGAWWSVFGDPVLDRLVARAAEGSTSVRQAAARLAKARAAARAAGAVRMPQAAFTAGASRQGGPLVNAAGTSGNLFEAGAGVAWEADVAGRLSRAEEAAALDLRAREALLRQARLLMQSEVAQAWFALRAADQEAALQQADVQALRETLRLVERRRAAGLAPEQEVARARSEVGAAEAEALQWKARREALEHALAYLCGTTAAELRLDVSASPFNTPVIPAGIPATVLARRPDVAAAEAELQAARARVGAAGQLWAPDFTLTASGGQASSQLGDLLKSAARSWSLGALLALPLFDGGRREARLDAADADLELAVATWRDKVLAALREVEDQLSSLHWLAAEAAALAAPQEDARRAAALAQSRYERGLTSQLEVVDAQAAARRLNHAALRVQVARQQATVALVRALGGGWGPTATTLAAKED